MKTLKDFENEFMPNGFTKEMCFDVWFYQLPSQQMEIMALIINKRGEVSTKEIQDHTHLQTKNISSQLNTLRDKCYRLKARLIDGKNHVYYLIS